MMMVICLFGDLVIWSFGYLSIDGGQWLNCQLFIGNG